CELAVLDRHRPRVTAAVCARRHLDGVHRGAPDPQPLERDVPTGADDPVPVGPARRNDQRQVPDRHVLGKGIVPRAAVDEEDRVRRDRVAVVRRQPDRPRPQVLDARSVLRRDRGVALRDPEPLRLVARPAGELGEDDRPALVELRLEDLRRVAAVLAQARRVAPVPARLVLAGACERGTDGSEAETGGGEGRDRGAKTPLHAPMLTPAAAVAYAPGGESAPLRRRYNGARPRAISSVG